MRIRECHNGGSFTVSNGCNAHGGYFMLKRSSGARINTDAFIAYHWKGDNFDDRAMRASGRGFRLACMLGRALDTEL